MKNINWGKVAKTAGIIAIIVLVILYFDNRRAKRENIQWDRVADLSYVSKELERLKGNCSDSRDTKDYDEIYGMLSLVEDKCDELSRIVDDVRKYLTPEEPDYDNSRSWWY